MKRTYFIRIIKTFGYLGFLVLSVLIILEICFRYQVIDFYKSELNGLNPQLYQSTDKGNILIFGDSFTAHPESYVKYLRKNFPEFNFINAAVPGTGILQHQLVARKRIEKFKPKFIIYQFYVGNDFTDIRHPINFKNLSLARNLFWMISEKLLILQHLNHKLAFLKSGSQTITQLHQEGFSAERYNNRVKLYFKGDSSYLSNTIQLKEKEIQVYEKWKETFEEIKSVIPDSIPVFLLMLPHCAQVSNVYLDRMKQLGAGLSAKDMETDYPLYLAMNRDLKGVKIISPLEAFQNTEKIGERLFYSNDPHLTPDGQKYLGEYLIQNLNFTHE